MTREKLSRFKEEVEEYKKICKSIGFHKEIAKKGTCKKSRKHKMRPKMLVVRNQKCVSKITT